MFDIKMSAGKTINGVEGESDDQNGGVDGR